MAAMRRVILLYHGRNGFVISASYLCGVKLKKNDIMDAKKAMRIQKMYYAIRDVLTITLLLAFFITLWMTTR